MRPRELVGELLSLLGDPQGDIVTPDMALRHLNSAQNEVADLLFNFMPERFRTVSTDGGDGGNEYLLPSACHTLERLTVRSTSGADEVEAVELERDRWNAVLHNDLFAASIAPGQLFFTRYGSSKVSIRPALSVSNIISFTYRQTPAAMQYDYGKGVYDLDIGPPLVSRITDATRSWPTDYWADNEAKVAFPANRPANEYNVSSNTNTYIDLTASAGLADGNYEYEVYIPTNIPAQYHPMLVHRAWLRAAIKPEQLQTAQMLVDGHLKWLLASHGGGS